ncbi:hypothetical protein, partial [Arenimonas caeni]
MDLDHDVFGFLAGGATGLLLGWVLALQLDLRRTQRDLLALRQFVARGATAAAPGAAPPVAASPLPSRAEPAPAPSVASAP